MLDAVLEDVSLTLTIGFRILLGTQNDGFRAVFTVDLIQCLVEPFHLLMPLSVVVDEVGLYAVVRTDAHDDDSGSFIVIALTENPLRATCSGLYYLLGGIGGSEKSFLGHIPVLRQVFAEMVGVNEDADGLGHRLLLSQLFGTAGCEVGDAGAQGIHIRHHARERARGADALFLAHVLHRNAVDAVQFLPSPDGHYIVQRGTNP